MKKLIFAAGLIAAFAAGWTINALAEYRGPRPSASAASAQNQSTTLDTVAKVLQYGQDDQIVTLSGYVVKQLGKEKFLFKDDTGEMIIEIESESMPQANFDEKTKVEIRGEIEKDFPGHIEIEVQSLKIL